MQESLEKLSNDIKELRDSRVSADESTALATRLDEITEKTTRIGDRSYQWIALRDAQVIKDSNQNFIAKEKNTAIDAIKHAQEAFGKGDAPIEHPELGQLDSPIQAILQDMEISIQVAWEEHKQLVGSKIQIDPAALVAFTRIEKFAPATAEITALMRTVNELLATPATTQVTITNLNNGVDKLVAIIATFFDQMPSEVVDFVRAASSDGAGITALSSEVLEWIKDNGLESNFNVRLIGSNT